MPDVIYKIATREQWAEAEAQGVFLGAPIDHEDGFIHFSDASQVRQTVALHFAGADDLLLVSVETAELGEALRYEVSRGGESFPHLYASLPLAAATNVEALPLGADGRHLFPDSFPG